MYRCLWRSVIQTHKGSLGRVAGVREFSARPWPVEQNRSSIGAAGGESSNLVPVKVMRNERHCGPDREDVSNTHQPRPTETDRATYVALLQNCTRKRLLPEAKRIHAQMVEAGVGPDIFLSNLLINMYVKCRSVLDAHQVFKEMPRRDVISWNSLISCYAQQGFKKKAFQLFEEMQNAGFIPNKITYISILTACYSPAELENGKKIHSQIIKAGYQRDPRVQNSLLSICLQRVYHPTKSLTSTCLMHLLRLPCWMRARGFTSSLLRRV